MAIRLSRRKITSYIAGQLADGVKVDQLALPLAAFLIDSRRTNELGLIVRDIEYQLSRRGIVFAKVTSAFDLTKSTQAAVTKMITEQTGAQKVELCQFVDPRLLGGVKVDLPGLQLDATIARRLTLLRTNYKK